MPVVNMKHMLEHAYQHNYAVGAFDVINLEFLQGVLEAAERCRGPVILSVSASHLPPSDLGALLSAVETAAQRASVPTAIHLDGGCDILAAVNGINKGCNGVKAHMAGHDLAENIARTSDVTGMAHQCGVTVEGQVGYARTPEQTDTVEAEVVQTSVAEAKVYAERTGVDCLAVFVGTAHFTGEGKRKVDWSRLKQINEALSRPLVFHLGSRLSDDQIHRLILNGVAKINDHTVGDTVSRCLKRLSGTGEGDCRAVMMNMREVVSEEVERRMRLWGAAGRAAEVAERCDRWAPVDQLIDCNGNGLDERQLKATLNHGVEVLRGIPGVRNVYTLKGVGGHRGYSWLVRFCHPEASESARHHPDFAAFADKRVLSSHGEGNRRGGFDQEQNGKASVSAQNAHRQTPEAKRPAVPRLPTSAMSSTPRVRFAT